MTFHHFHTSTDFPLWATYSAFAANPPDESQTCQNNHKLNFAENGPLARRLDHPIPFKVENSIIHFVTHSSHLPHIPSPPLIHPTSLTIKHKKKDINLHLFIFSPSSFSSKPSPINTLHPLGHEPRSDPHYSAPPTFHSTFPQPTTSFS